MDVVVWPGETAPGPSVCAVGVFDGVHVGHQALLRDAVALARSEGVLAAVLTFEPDPEVLLRPDDPPARIVSREDRRILIETLGVDRLVEVPFDDTLAAMDPERFLEDVMDAALAPLALVVGEDFVFGRGGRGDVALMRRHGAENGYAVYPHELVFAGGVPVTATRIREAVSAGRVAEATELLGREHVLHGTVVPGRGLGEGLGAPTANLVVPPEMLVPGDGVYACWAESALSGRVRAAVAIGAPPTYPGAPPAVEAHLLDMDVPLYHETLTLRFVERLRDQQAFETTHDLAEAIAADIERTRRLLGD